MAEKQEKAAKPEKKDNILVSAAKVIGTAAAKIATLGKTESGEASVKPATTPKRPGRLVKKEKHRLPRREKKAQKKAAAKAGIPSPS